MPNRNGGAPPGKCGICRDPRRDTLERLLLDGHSCRGVAAQYGLLHHTVARHYKLHMLALLRQAAAAEEDRPRSLLERVRWRSAKAELLADLAPIELRVGLDRVALAAYELEGKITGEIPTASTQVQINVFAKIGVDSEDEARRLVDIARQVEAPKTLSDRVRIVEQFLLAARREDATLVAGLLERLSRASGAELIEEAHANGPVDAGDAARLP